MRLPPAEGILSKAPTTKTILHYLAGGLILLIATATLIFFVGCDKPLKSMTNKETRPIIATLDIWEATHCQI